MSLLLGGGASHNTYISYIILYLSIQEYYNWNWSIQKRKPTIKMVPNVPGSQPPLNKWLFLESLPQDYQRLFSRRFISGLKSHCYHIWTAYNLLANLLFLFTKATKKLKNHHPLFASRNHSAKIRIRVDFGWSCVNFPANLMQFLPRWAVWSSYKSCSIMAPLKKNAAFWDPRKLGWMVRIRGL